MVAIKGLRLFRLPNQKDKRMTLYTHNEVIALLRRVTAATEKMLWHSAVIVDKAALQALSELNKRAALYVIDLSSLLQEESLQPSTELDALIDMVEGFCGEIEALPDDPFAA